MDASLRLEVPASTRLLRWATDARSLAGSLDGRVSHMDSPSCCDDVQATKRVSDKLGSWAGGSQARRLVFHGVSIKVVVLVTLNWGSGGMFEDELGEVRVEVDLASDSNHTLAVGELVVNHGVVPS